MHKNKSFHTKFNNQYSTEFYRIGKQSRTGALSHFVWCVVRRRRRSCRHRGRWRHRRRLRWTPLQPRSRRRVRLQASHVSTTAAARATATNERHQSRTCFPTLAHQRALLRRNVLALRLLHERTQVRRKDRSRKVVRNGEQLARIDTVEYPLRLNIIAEIP